MKCFKHRDRDDSISETKIPEMIPWAEYQTDLPLMKARGDMKPSMIVVHFTAGHQEQKGRDAVKFAIKNGHGYLFIDKSGQLYQQCHLDKWYYHAGKSVGPKFTTQFNRTNLSKYSIGIEVASAGKLKRDGNGWKTWFNKQVTNFRHIGPGMGYVHEGVYQMFTKEQEETLIETVMYLCKKFGIPTCNVVGHDEIAPDRKNDPGGALSMSMADFRRLIEDKLRDRYAHI